MYWQRYRNEHRGTRGTIAEHELNARSKVLEAMEGDAGAEVKLRMALPVSSGNSEIATVLYEESKQRSMGFWMGLRSIKMGRSNEMLERKMRTLITNYQENIRTAVSVEDKLFAIISFIQACEQLHPFLDANCRVFCMLLLNHLLIRNGFP